jgi:hypothetical protein
MAALFSAIPITSVSKWPIGDASAPPAVTDPAAACRERRFSGSRRSASQGVKVGRLRIRSALTQFSRRP